MTRQTLLRSLSGVLLVLALPVTAAQDRNIAVTDLDTVIKHNPLQPGGGTAAIVASFPAGDNELEILLMSKNRLHHHTRQDHVLYVARGHGIARLENAAGKIETRPIKPGDILSLPHGKQHAFTKIGKDDLVFLVLAGPGRDADDDTTFHE